MARWTFALILICLPILATVITAFRVRDLPKSSQESFLKKQKCDDCDTKSNVFSAKIDSDKYDELKKIPRDKQTVTSQKILDVKLTHKYEVKSDEDDDDEPSFPKLKTGFRQEIPKVSKVVKSDLDLKPRGSKISLISDDDDGDDENDSNDDSVTRDKKTKTIVAKKIDIKLQKPSTEKKLRPALTLTIDDDDSDDDDEDDDEEENERQDEEFIRKNVDLINIIQKSDTGTKVMDVGTLKQLKNKYIDHHDIDDEDDDDNDDGDNNGSDNSIVTTIKGKSTTKVSPKLPILKNEEKTLSKKLETIEDTPKKIIKKHDIKNNIEKDDSNQKISKPESKIKDLKTETKPKTETIKKELKLDLKPKVEKSDTVKTDQVKSKQSAAEEPKKKPSPAIKEQSIQTTPPIKDSAKTEKPPKIAKPELKVDEKKIEKTESVQPKKNIEKPKDKTADMKKDSKKEDIRFESKKKSDSASKEIVYDSKETKTDNLKQVTDALNRRNLLKSEFEDLYAFFPTFAPNFSRIHNAECRRHGQIVLRQLRGTKIWALNMLDATAKIPSGILQGNGIQLGDFDQCLGSRARVQLDTGSVVKVQGKYCLVHVDIKAEQAELEVPVHLAQAKNLIRSRIDDPGHFVPRFSTLSWGVCVPSACNTEDVELVVKDAVKHYQRTTGLVVRVKVEDTDCYLPPGDEWWQEWLELPTVLTLSLYAVVILLVFIGTILDFLARRKVEDSTVEDSQLKQKETQSSVISAFSLYRTVPKLLAPNTADEIPCIHGIRGIATLALLLLHKIMPIAVMPYTNRIRITELVSSAFWSWTRAGWMYTDCFLLLSAALTTHRICTDVGSSSPGRLLSRYLRLTPALLAVVLFYAYVWDKLATGPMWGTFVTKNAKVCQDGWWWNLLYVQNYFNLEDMCAAQTHQLALDMQLTILGCVIVWLVNTKTGLGKILLPGLHALAAYSRYTTVHDHRLTLLAYHGVSVSQLYRTARLSYTSTLHRSTPYLVGISLGIALTKPSQHSKLITIPGWIISIGLWSLVWWAGLDSGDPQYRYNAGFAARYAAFCPIAASMAIAWVVYIVHSGNCDFLSRRFSCPVLVFISRISYALYLCQFIVFLTNAGMVKTSSEFGLMALVDFREISAILLSSIVLTLTFVIPMQSLHKVFLLPTKVESPEVKQQAKHLETVKEELESEFSDKRNEEIITDLPEIRHRQHIIAHRELLPEIPEAEIEYEMRRSNDGLEEILEEEEDEEYGEESQNNFDDELEMIEEEQAGEEDWQEREYEPRQSYSRQDDRDLDEWEWTANGRNGAQFYRNR